LATKVINQSYDPKFPAIEHLLATTCRHAGIHRPTLVQVDLFGVFHPLCCHFASAKSFTPKIKPFLLVNAVYTLFIIPPALTP
jgi:hypothetical protein